jgi:hypothetical protein
VPEESEEDERRGEVSGDQEGEEEVVVLVDVPAEETRKDNRVAEARDREELGESLKEAERNGLEVGDERREDDDGFPVGPNRPENETSAGTPSTLWRARCES